MRSLTSTLLSAQKQATRSPYVKVEAKNTISGVARLDWTRLYTGSEDDYFHALTMPGDGSLIRVRITLPADSRKLYHQRVANPSPSSDYSQWTYTNQYNVVVCACASLGAEVSIFWTNSSREIRRIKSTDYGVTWGSSELIDYSPTTAIYGLAAAYKPNGDLAIFFADQATLYVKKHVAGAWQTKAAWDKTTGDLSGVATVYDSDWNLLVTGKDTADNYKLWSLIFGDGGDIAAGTWSALKEFALASSGGNYEYRRVFMDKPDVYRGFYVEKFTGTEAYNRPFWSHSIPDTTYLSSLWREPVPFNLSSEYGLAIAHSGDYCWLSSPAGVWRAPLTIQSLDLTTDILSVRQETGQSQGKLTVELRNDDGRYALLPSPLDIGCQLEFSPGYVTIQATMLLRPNAAGDETTLTIDGSSPAPTNWGSVNEVIPDEAVTFVRANSYDWQRDLYNIANSSSGGTISLIKVTARCMAIFAPTRTGLKIAIKTGGTAYEGDEETLVSGTWIDYSKTWATNPKTGENWTWADIDALQIGVSLRFGKPSPGASASGCTQVYVEVYYGGGNEVSSGRTFVLEAYEHTSSGGKASLILHGLDGWRAIDNWRARHQFRWNKDSNEMSVKQILEFVLARVGLKLEVKSQSSVITGYYPDFTINPNNQGDLIIRRLLSFVPDVVFIEGNKAYVVNPQSSDNSDYSYGSAHPIFEGKYRAGAGELNRVQVEGYDTSTQAPIIAESFAWGGINRLYDRLQQLYDRNLDTVAKVQARGEAYLREAEIDSADGIIRIPVNCGQQFYDVIDITDSRAGLSAEKRRVLGLILVYQPSQAQYEHRLALGAV